MKIEIADRQDALVLDLPRLRRETKALLEAAGWSGELSLALVMDEEIHEVNRRFLGHDRPTDVIAFPLDEGEAEIVVSAERAVEEAAAREVAPLAELMLYIVHGILHLAGFEDGDEVVARAMHDRSLELLGVLGYVNEIP